MPRRLTSRLALLGLLAALASTPLSSAHAKDIGGRLGIGGAVQSNFTDSGLSIKYWLGDVGFQTLLSLNVTEDGDQNLDWDIGFGIRGLYNLSRTETTNLFVGGGVLLHQVIGGDGDRQRVELLLGVEHFLSDYFSVAGHVALGFALSGGVEIDFGRVAAWGSSFHFYF